MRFPGGVASFVRGYRIYCSNQRFQLRDAREDGPVADTVLDKECWPLIDL